MPSPIVAIAASGVGSAIVAKSAADKAADAQNRATDAAVSSGDAQIDLFREIFDQQREDQTPWRELGAQATASLQEGLESGAFTMDDWQFSADPGYEFRRRQGEKYLENTAAANGNFLSGRRLKAATEYNQGFASDEYNRAFAREAGERGDRFNFLAGAAGLGQTSVQSTNADASRMGSNIGNALGMQGQAIAAGAQNIGNIQSSMYSNVAGAANQGIENYLTWKGLG